jgi:hypothetical protein
MAALSVVLATTLTGMAGAAPAAPAEDELASLARALLLTENAAMLGDADRARALTDVRPTLTAGFQRKARARLALSEDRRVAREAAGVHVDRVTTEVKVRSVSGDGPVRVAEIEEHSGYPVVGSKQGTSSKSLHRVTYEWSNGRWALADIVPQDEISNFSDRALVAALPDEQRRAAIRHRVASVRAGITANLPALRAADAAKMKGKQVTAPDALRSEGTKSTGGTAGLGRPAGKPFVGTAEDQVQAQGGEGRPYDYQAMVNYAWYYAEEPVPYTRDTNDCTTFISWVLWNGRYEERGSESYPETLWNYDDADVWYYRCNDCTPRHTYTWGGALNWNVYENNFGGRVTFMPYLSDLLLSDVFQMEMDHYGDPPGVPDHTTMVTGRDSETGWPLLSYHTRDTRDKALWEVIGVEDGPFWAIRT